jgi:penicillin-binding protein 1A
VLALTSFCVGFMTAAASSLSQLDPQRRQPQVDGKIVTEDGSRVLAILRGSEARTIVDSSQIAPIMKHAIVAIEDRRFYEHRGIDVHGLLRALWTDLSSGKIVEGGSTITQQFVKNTYRQNQRTIARKLREAALAWQLEQRWSKDRILTAYLNTIFFGNGAYGIEQAARTYFDTTAAKLTLSQAALLAGIPRDPGLYDPVRNPRAAKARRALVLEKMVEQGDITRADARRANSAPMPAPGKVNLGATQSGVVPYFTNYVKQQLTDALGPTHVYGTGIDVSTSIDLGLQKIAHQAIAKWLPDTGGADGTEAALVALDPRDGRVLALVGGRNYRKRQFDLATQAERQPGSSFKPFVLAAALEKGISPQTTFVSAPLAIPLGDRTWYVHNDEDAYQGLIDLNSATTYSDNTVFAQLTRLVGPTSVVRVARRLGITSPLYAYYSIGLGGEPVNPLEMARAYAVFADGGIRVDGSYLGNRPRAVLAVRLRDGTLKLNAPVEQRVLPEQDAAIITSMLQNVVRSGTGVRAALPDRPVAGKTGTTSDYGDAWFVGYTPQLVTVVWVGHPDKLVPMRSDFHGAPVMGGTYPALIFKSFMQDAFAYLEKTDPSGGWEPESFPSPTYPATTSKLLTYRNGRALLDNGLCRSTFPVVYFSGFGPTRAAHCLKNEVEVPRVVGDTVPEASARLLQQPLKSQVIYRPAKPFERPNVVVDQIPKKGFMSSWQTVTLVLATPVNGLIPNVVGLTPAEARRKLARVHMRLRIASFARGKPGRILYQSHRSGGAAAPQLTLSVVVGRSARRPASAAAARG